MYCRFCGQQMPDDSRFCVNCGKPMEGAPSDNPSVHPSLSTYGILVVRRHPSVQDASVPADIYVDEAKAGYVNNGMDCRIRLPIGKHSVKIMIKSRYVGTRYVDISDNENTDIVFAADDVLRIPHGQSQVESQVDTSSQSVSRRAKPRKSAVLLFALALTALLAYLFYFHGNVSAKTAFSVFVEQIRYYINFVLDWLADINTLIEVDHVLASGD